jgi:glycosyltransferase involved in cell wall biosynthesis
MIVNRGDAEVHALLVRKRPDNVTLFDYHPADQMPDLLRKSWLFLSTSSAEFEGFPNVLLEASASGTPIVSLEDFDGFLARSQAGLVADGNTVTAANLIQSLADRPELWNELAGSAMAYVQLHHERKMVIRKFRDWILRC